MGIIPSSLQLAFHLYTTTHVQLRFFLYFNMGIFSTLKRCGFPSQLLGPPLCCLCDRGMIGLHAAFIHPGEALYQALASVRMFVHLLVLKNWAT